MAAERQQLEAGIVALEAQRALLGHAVVDAALGPMRARLQSLAAADGASAGATPAAEPVQTLKQVSVLFADVVGSTTLSQRLDPEAVGSVMDGALARGTALVEAHGGKVLQYAGDSILAAFGAAEAREDDAERAVRCGLALLELGRALGAEVQAAHGHAGFDLRVGIHTGGVLLGGGMDADGAIRGVAVNIAARMEQTAPAGALRISHDTYALVRGVFEVEAQPPLAVKGVDEPVQSYLVTRAKPRSFRIGTRGIEGVATKMIGREAELETLQDAFKRLFAERRLAAITVVADAGIGKSRLLYEFDAWSEARPEPFFIFQGRASPQTQGQPFGLLRDIFAWRFQIADDDTLEAARQKMEQGVVPLFLHDDGAELAESHAHLLGHLIGIEWRDSRHIKGILDDPRQLRNRAFHAAAQTFRRVSAAAGLPVLLQLEDLHWADNATLDFLAYLAEVDRDVPLLILAFSRPTLFERRAAWCAEAVHQRLDLAPLDKRASRDLANELLKQLPEVPAALRELVIGGSEGNPFYMEELVKMLIDQGAIETGRSVAPGAEPGTGGVGGGGGGGWRVNAERLLLTHVPATLTGVLQARLDGLPAAERLTLQQASVIGQVFWDRALIALDAQARDTLPALVSRELALLRPGGANNAAREAAASVATDADADVDVDGAAADDLREYAFKHALLHQVTYATVLKRSKRELHGKLAHWLAAQTGLRANDFLAAAAEHFEQAGDLVNAAEFHARAAEQARSRLAHDAVRSHVQRALALIDKLPGPDASAGTNSRTNSGTRSGTGTDAVTHHRRLRWRLLEAREFMAEIAGDRAAQRADIAAMEALADALGDDRQRAHAAYRRGYLALRTADFPAMEAAARRAVAWARPRGQGQGRGELQLGVQVGMQMGEHELRLMAQRMLALARVSQGDLAAGQALARDTLVEAQSLGLHRVEAFCLNTLGMIAERQGDDVAGLALDQQSLLALQSTGDRRSEAIGRVAVGVGWLGLGALAEARRELEEGLRLVRLNGDRAIECAPLCNLSALALWQGDDTRALALARSALETAVAVQARDWEAVALCRLGDADAALGRHAAAAQSFTHALARATEIDSPFRHDAAAGQARVALAQGDVTAALQAIAPLLALADEAAKVATQAADAGVDADAALLEGTEFPHLIEWTCHEVLVQAGDPRAAHWLRRAHEALQTQAARITDAQLRLGLLHNIPHHREIVAAWAAWSLGAAERAAG